MLGIIRDGAGKKPKETLPEGLANLKLKIDPLAVGKVLDG